MEENLENSLEAIDISQFKLNSAAFKQTFEFKKKNDPAFKNMTHSRFVNLVGICESTWKKILSGQMTDAMCSTAWAAGRALGLDMNVVFGLAPMRDYDREKQEYNPTLMDNMRRQVISLDEQARHKDEKIKELLHEIDKLETSNNKLQSEILTLTRELSMEKQKNTDHEDVMVELKRARNHKHTLAVCLIVSAALTILFASIMIYKG